MQSISTEKAIPTENALEVSTSSSQQPTGNNSHRWKTWVVLLGTAIALLILFASMPFTMSLMIRMTYPSVKATITGISESGIVQVGKKVTFSAGQSQGKGLSYQWEFDPAPNEGKILSGKDVTVTFPHYDINASVKLSVHDPLGTSDKNHENSTKLKFYIYPVAPKAHFIYTLIDPDSFHLGKEIIVKFDATRSEGTELKTYTWDFGDGQTGQSNEGITEHSYGKNDTFTTSVTVTDVVGQKNTFSQQVDVSFPPPTASFKVDVSAFSAGYANVTFDASNSTGYIKSYIWDFGDGQTKESSTNSDFHYYRRTGTFTVTLKVTDLAGQTATASQTITVK
jgi:PKD repeat protein